MNLPVGLGMDGYSMVLLALRIPRGIPMNFIGGVFGVRRSIAQVLGTLALSARRKGENDEKLLR